MPPKNCHLCAEPLQGAIASITFEGFATLALNGVTFIVHARCLRFEPTAGRDVTLAPRISDPVAEADLVTVYGVDGEWDAYCHGCGTSVALKDNREDAHLGAVRHLARVHAGVAA